MNYSFNLCFPKVYVKSYWYCCTSATEPSIHSLNVCYSFWMYRNKYFKSRATCASFISVTSANTQSALSIIISDSSDKSVDDCILTYMQDWDSQQRWNNQCGSNERWHCARLYECVSRNPTHFFCLAVTALCWWLTASLCWNNWSTCCICPWVAAIKFTSLLSRTSPCYRSACPKCFCVESLLKCWNIFLSVMWARCSLRWVCWTCLVWCTTAICPP